MVTGEGDAGTTVTRVDDNLKNGTRSPVTTMWTSGRGSGGEWREWWRWCKAGYGDGRGEVDSKG